MKVKKDVISGIFFMGLGVMIFFSSYTIKTNMFSQFSSSLLPRTVAALMFMLGTLEVIVSWRAEGADNPAISKKALMQVCISIISMLVYALSIDVVGFIIMTTLLMFVQMLIISNWKYKKSVSYLIISAGSSVAFYYLFSQVFYLMLPQGILG